MRLTLSSLGKFTGHILNAGGSDSFSGMFDINGYFSGSVSRAGATPLALEMNFRSDKWGPTHHGPGFQRELGGLFAG